MIMVRERRIERERKICHVPVFMRNPLDSKWGDRKSLTSCRATVMWPDVGSQSADTMHKPMSDDQTTRGGGFRTGPEELTTSPAMHKQTLWSTHPWILIRDLIFHMQHSKQLSTCHEMGTHAFCRCATRKDRGGGSCRGKRSRGQEGVGVGAVEVEVAPNYRLRTTLLKAKSKYICEILLLKPQINTIQIQQIQNGRTHVYPMHALLIQMNEWTHRSEFWTCYLSYLAASTTVQLKHAVRWQKLLNTISFRDSLKLLHSLVLCYHPFYFSNSSWSDPLYCERVNLYLHSWGVWDGEL